MTKCTSTVQGLGLRALGSRFRVTERTVDGGGLALAPLKASKALQFLKLAGLTMQQAFLDQMCARQSAHMMMSWNLVFYLTRNPTP